MCSCVRFSCHVRLDDVKQFNHGRCWAVAVCFSCLDLRVRRDEGDGNKNLCHRMETNVLFVFSEHEDLFWCVHCRNAKKETKEKIICARKSPDNRPTVKVQASSCWRDATIESMSCTWTRCDTNEKKQTHLLLSDFRHRSQIATKFSVLWICFVVGDAWYFSLFSSIFSLCVAAKHMISYATRKPNIARFFHMHSHTFGASSVSGCNFSFRRCSQQKSTSPKWFQEKKNEKEIDTRENADEYDNVCVRVHKIPEMERITLHSPRANSRIYAEKVRRPSYVIATHLASHVLTWRKSCSSSFTHERFVPSSSSSLSLHVAVGSMCDTHLP